MREVESTLFTVAVFQDVAWAEKGIEALKRQGLPPEALSIVGKESPEVAGLIERTLGAPGERIEVRNLGAVLARGLIVAALDRTGHDLASKGIAASIRHVGFQAHDGRIFETLTARGGVLVAVRSEPLAADALATLHSYGGGNAAIGAWKGRV